MVVSRQPLPRMGLGMAALGRPGYINLNRDAVFGSSRQRTVDVMQGQANAVMDILFDVCDKRSIKPWLDCARSYGLSEQFVGDYLRSHNVASDSVYVSSKWGYTYVADFQVSLEPGQPHEVKDHSTENFLKQLEETVQHMGEYVNLYQIHSATFESGVLTDTRAHEALDNCRNQRGWAIGLSVSSPQQGETLTEALEIKVNGRPLFDSVQCTFNVLEQRPADALMKAHEAGIDIILKEGLANGRVLQHPAIVNYAKQLDCKPDHLALACLLAQPFEPRVLSGAATPEHLESNFQAMDISRQWFQGNPRLLQEIMTACLMESDAYWTERSALPWN